LAQREQRIDVPAHSTMLRRRSFKRDNQDWDNWLAARQAIGLGRADAISARNRFLAANTASVVPGDQLDLHLLPNETAHSLFDQSKAKETDCLLPTRLTTFRDVLGETAIRKFDVV
jgi:hypothetical protein